MLDEVFVDECPTFIKIDVEGMELMVSINKLRRSHLSASISVSRDLINSSFAFLKCQVLHGAQRVLQQCMPVLYIENNCRKGSKELITFVNDLDYTCHWDVHPYFSEANFRNNKMNIFHDAHSINMLCFSKNDRASVQKAEKLPNFTRLDVASKRYELHEYNLTYVGKEDVVLTQLGTREICER